MNKQVIEDYAMGAGKVARAIEGLTKGDLLAAPGGALAGTWTIGQIVLHLMDSDLIASDRMKRIIAEENPAIIGYDEGAFSRKLFYEKQDEFAAAEVFRKNREMTAVILRNLPAEAFERYGTHNERGRMTLGEMVEMYVKHLEHHLGFVRRKREMMGKALK